MEKIKQTSNMWVYIKLANKRLKTDRPLRPSFLQKSDRPLRPPFLQKSGNSVIITY